MHEVLLLVHLPTEAIWPACSSLSVRCSSFSIQRYTLLSPECAMAEEAETSAAVTQQEETPVEVTAEETQEAEDQVAIAGDDDGHQ